jgi:hypothetical protein
MERINPLPDQKKEKELIPPSRRHDTGSALIGSIVPLSDCKAGLVPDWVGFGFQAGDGTVVLATFSCILRSRVPLWKSAC